MWYFVILIEELCQCGVNFRSLIDSIDISILMGCFFFYVMGVLVEMECELIVECIRVGLVVVCVKGRVGGCCFKLIIKQWVQIGCLFEVGELRQCIVLIFDVGVFIIYRKFLVNENNELF